MKRKTAYLLTAVLYLVHMPNARMIQIQPIPETRSPDHNETTSASPLTGSTQYSVPMNNSTTASAAVPDINFTSPSPAFIPNTPATTPSTTPSEPPLAAASSSADPDLHGETSKSKLSLLTIFWFIIVLGVVLVLAVLFFILYRKRSCPILVQEIELQPLKFE